MKHTLLLITLLAFLIPGLASADRFSCDLALNLIEDTNSSEIKRLIFEVDLSENTMTGAMISTSCFNKITEPFISNSSNLRIESSGDLPYGTLKNSNMVIGKYHYQFDLAFSQFTDVTDKFKNIDFIATGKIFSLDNVHFIHQNAEGRCHLSEE